MATAQNEGSVRLMTRAAMLYYRQGLTQQEVAARLGLSRATVGRILARAEETGVVTINISSPIDHVVEAEIVLEEAFGLVEVVVVESSNFDDDESIRSDLGRGCAELIARRLAPGMVLGLGWSRTVQHISSHLHAADLTLGANAVTVVQLDGATPPRAQQSHPLLGIIAVATELEANQLMLPAPLYTDSETTALGLLKDKSVREALDTAARADLCIFGIGNLSDETTLVVNGDIDRETMDSLSAQGAVGDICGRFFDSEGRAINGALAARTISVELDVLAGRPLRVAAVSGVSRVPAILAALKGNLLNGLVTDAETARALLAARKADDAR